MDKRLDHTPISEKWHHQAINRGFLCQATTNSYSNDHTLGETNSNRDGSLLMDTVYILLHTRINPPSDGMDDLLGSAVPVVSGYIILVYLSDMGLDPNILVLITS